MANALDSQPGKKNFQSAPLEVRFWALVQKTEGCWLWVGARTGPYGKILLWTGPGTPRRYRRAHRVVWELTHGPIPAGLLVCHRCDTPLCVNPDHLFLGTDADNRRDCANKGRVAKQKLRQADLDEIRSSSLSCKELTEKYGVSGVHIRRILKGRTHG